MTDRKILSFTFPTNLGYLASYVLEHFPELDVKIIDFEAPPYFNEHDFISRLKTEKPRIIGFTAMTNSINTVFFLANLVKRYSPESITVVGGSHFNALPELTLEQGPAIDIGVYGEGEVTFKEIVTSVLKGNSYQGVKGIFCREKETGKIVFTGRRELIANIDTIPFPLRDSIDWDYMRKRHSIRGIKTKSIDVFTSRGCPYSCNFCATHLTFGKTFRQRSIDNISSEIDELISKYSIDTLLIAEDTFGIDKTRALELAEMIKSKNLKGFQIYCRVDSVDLELLRHLKECGCIRIVYGIESGSDRILDLMKKGISVEKIKKACLDTFKAGIPFEGDFLIGGHPSETIDEIKMTHDLIKEIPFDTIAVSIVVPYPGTGIHNIMKQKDYIQTDNWDDFSIFGTMPKWKTDHFTGQQLLTIQKRLMRNFYLSPEILLARIKEIRRENIAYYLSAGFDFIKWLARGGV